MAFEIFPFDSFDFFTQNFSQTQTWRPPQNPAVQANLFPTDTFQPSADPAAAAAGDPGASLHTPNLNFDQLANTYSNNLDAYYHNHGAPHGIESNGQDMALAQAAGSDPVMTAIKWVHGKPQLNYVDASSPESAGHPTRAPLPPGVDPAGMPKIFGATPEEAAKIYQTLSALPVQDRESIRSIVVGNVHGVDLARQYNNPNPNGNQPSSQGVVEISRQELNDPKIGTHVLLHEVGHAVDAAYGITGQQGSPWGSGQLVTPYAGKDPAEDFAESYAAYYGSKVPGDAADQTLSSRLDPVKEAALANGDLGSNYVNGTPVVTGTVNDPAADANFLNVELQRQQARGAAGWSQDQILNATASEEQAFTNGTGENPWGLGRERIDIADLSYLENLA